MLIDEYPPKRFDPLRTGAIIGALGWAGILPILPVTQEEQMNKKGANAVQDVRIERMTRAGYLLVIGAEGSVRVAAAFLRRTVRSLMKMAPTERHLSSADIHGREI